MNTTPLTSIPSIPSILSRPLPRPLLLPVLLALLLGATQATAVEVSRHAGDWSELHLAGGSLIASPAGAPPRRLTLRDGRLHAEPWHPPSTPPLPADRLPDAVIVDGSGTIARSWLGGATDRYGHGVLGDAIEAGTLFAVDRSGRRHAAVLDADRVFEDRLPRMADLDGDGDDELLVIRSELTAGAALASYGLADGELVEEAASAPIGRANRWLNVAGIADFDGDGRLEVAAVVTPHIGGTLTLYRQQGRVLQPVMSLHGFSNHRIGDRELGMSAVADLDGDAIADLLVPDTRRRDLQLVRVRDGQLESFGRIENRGEIRSGLLQADLDGLPGDEIAYLLDDGTLVIVRP